MAAVENIIALITQQHWLVDAQNDAGIAQIIGQNADRKKLQMQIKNDHAGIVANNDTADVGTDDDGTAIDYWWWVI